MPDLDLNLRTGLPDALRVLLADYPRADWPAHRHFDGLVRFWLDRHLAFRQMTALLRADTEALLDARIDPQTFTSRLSRIGGNLVGDLLGHHQIEDDHYFPLLAQTEPRISSGFELLDRDHHALDTHIEDFVARANGVLGHWKDSAMLLTTTADFAASLSRLTSLLDRHLIDEEDLIVPVILRHGPGNLG
jgi:hemerythrin-like domain-containing protein